jgi:small subunit ribosomal protein S6
LNDYELVTILNGEIKDEDVDDTVERISQFITNRGGEVQNIDPWGRRRLAYPISRQFEGTYVVTHLRLPGANAAELEANLRISDDVLRHLLVRYSPAEQAAAIAAAQRRRPRPVSEDGPEGGPPNEATASAQAEPTAEAPTGSGVDVAETPAAVAPELVEAAAPATIEQPAPEAETEQPAPVAESATAAIADAEVVEAPAAEIEAAPEAETPAEAHADAAPAAEDGAASAETDAPAPRRARTRKPREDA